MPKKAKPAASYDHVTPQLIARVSAVIEDAAKHKYSVSRVYRAYNEAFQKRDVPQTCSSCLRNRVRELKTWVAGYKPVAKEPTAPVIPAPPVEPVEPTPPVEPVEPQYDDPSAPGHVAPAPGVVRFPMGEDTIPLDFTTGDNPNKGTALWADGSKVKVGTYTTATGAVIAVQPGGKATIKEPEEDLT